MPVEAIHLSALVDSLARLPPSSRMEEPRLRGAARLGAVTIDFPYFDRFALGVARYLLKQPTATSRWGNLFHEQQPLAVVKSLLAQARTLRARADTRSLGETLLAFALGYVSHAAVDRCLHPMVNRLAEVRAARLSDSALRQHTEVEKFHSVLFHEERNGFDFMGRRELKEHIAVDARALVRPSSLHEAYRTALSSAFGEAPSQRLLARWASGYAQYTWLVSGPFGKILMSEKVKREVRPEVYDGPGVSFVRDYEAAVEFSTKALTGALAFAETGAAEPELDGVLPEGPIDGSC